MEWKRIYVHFYVITYTQYIYIERERVSYNGSNLDLQVYAHMSVLRFLETKKRIFGIMFVCHLCYVLIVSLWLKIIIGLNLWKFKIGSNFCYNSTKLYLNLILPKLLWNYGLSILHLRLSKKSIDIYTYTRTIFSHRYWCNGIKTWNMLSSNLTKRPSPYLTPIKLNFQNLHIDFYETYNIDNF